MQPSSPFCGRGSKRLSKDGHNAGLLLNSGHLQLRGAYYFVFNYVPREPRCIHVGVVKCLHNLIATTICVLSKHVPLARKIVIPREIWKLSERIDILLEMHQAIFKMILHL